MVATTVGVAEAKNNFSKVTAEVSRTGRPVTVPKNNKPLVVTSPTSGVSRPDMVGLAVDFMQANDNDFEELAG